MAGNDRARARGAGVRQALAESGLALPDECVQYAPISLQAAEQAMQRMLALAQPPTAVVATNDVFAVGAMIACRKAGVRIPQDISITGVDNTDLGATQTPGLTSIRTPIVEIGHAAAAQLIARLDGLPWEPFQAFPIEVVHRGSTAPPAAKALRHRRDAAPAVAAWPSRCRRSTLPRCGFFVAVAQTGKISAGATICHLSVAAASKRISDMELRLGYSLFDRHARGVVATAAGERVMAYASEVIGLTEALENDLSDKMQGIEGSVRLFANSSAIVQFLPADLSGFLAGNPSIRVELSEHTSRGSGRCAAHRTQRSRHL